MKDVTLANIGIENFRDIGGYTADNGKQVRSNMVYRSAKLDGITEEGQRLFDTISIKTIIDFRDGGEVADSPTDYEREGLLKLRIPISSGDIKSYIPSLMSGKVKEQAAQALMCSAYRSFVTDYGKQYAQFLDVLLDEASYPILFHCTAGKDRTGYAAALLLSLLNVSWKEVMNNYLLTNDYLKDFISKLDVGSIPEAARSAFGVLMLVDEQYLDAAFNAISQDYESVSNYSSAILNFDREKQDRLKSILLE